MPHTSATASDERPREDEPATAPGSDGDDQEPVSDPGGDSDPTTTAEPVPPSD